MSAVSYGNHAFPDETGPARLLVLDDDRFDRKRIARWTRSIDHGAVEVVEAADLEQFAQALGETRFDLILIDYCLADGTGLDALDGVAASANNAGAFTIVMSGQRDAAHCAAAEARGCDRFLEKSELGATTLGQVMRQIRAARQPGPVPRSAGATLSAVQYWAARARRRARAAADTPEIREALEDAGGLLSVSGLISADLRTYLAAFAGPDEFEFDFDPPPG